MAALKRKFPLFPCSAMDVGADKVCLLLGVDAHRANNRLHKGIQVLIDKARMRGRLGL